MAAEGVIVQAAAGGSRMAAKRQPDYVEYGRTRMLGDTSSALSLIGLHGSEIHAQVDADGSTALHVAARGGQTDVMRQLLEAGCAANVLDLSSRTALHVACEEEHADAAALLLESGADPEAVDTTGKRAVHRAVRGHNVEVLRVLADAGADFTARDNTLASPLLLAAEYGRMEMVDFILSRDSQLASTINENDWTAMHLAAHGREKVRNSFSRPARFANCIQLLLNANASVDPRDMDNKTPLHRAAHVGNHETVAVLLAGKADVAARDNCRWTPLHYAVQEGHLDAAVLLLESGAAVQEAQPCCLTPLAVATLENQVKAAELLLHNKADPNLRGKGLASPMMIARKDPEKFDDILGLFELGFINHS